MKSQLSELRREDFQNAMKEVDTYIDVNVEDLLMLTKKALKYAQLRQTESMFVKDIMSRNVEVVSPNTSLKDAANLLLELRISGLPVVNSENKLIGIVTEADFLCALGIPCHHPAHSVWQTLESMFNATPKNSHLPNVVSDIMSTQPVTIGIDETLHEVIATMKHHHVKRLIVINEQETVVGIITRSNLVKVLLKRIL